MKIKSVQSGIKGGLAGGIVFGIMMGAMGMLPMVAKLVGSSSSTVGLVVHLINSVIIGGIFAVALGQKVVNMTEGIKLGVGYGIIWWVLGPLLIMPIALGMGQQLSLAGAQAAFPSLVGHILFGVVLGGVYAQDIDLELAEETVEEGS